MAEVPLTFARKDVPSPGGAPRMGQKISIHAYDPLYEQERRSIAGVARAITGTTQALTKEAVKFLQDQKAKEDKINFLQYQDRMNDTFNKYAEEYRQNPNFEEWGKDYENRMTESSKGLMDELKMSNEAREMGSQWFLQQGMNWKSQISRDYSIARMSHFDKESTFLLDKAVENGDVTSALVMAELRASNSPARTATLEADKKQIKERVWWNNELKAISNDPFNWKPPKAEDTPGGQKAVNSLVAEKNKLLYQEKVNLNERKQVMFAKLDDQLKQGILTVNTLDLYYDQKDKWGLPFLNKKQYDAYLADMQQKSVAVDKAKLSVLMDDIYYYDSSNDLDKSKWTDIQSRKREFGWKERNQVDIQIDKMEKRNKSQSEANKNMTPAQKDAFDRRIKILDQKFNVAAKEDVVVTHGEHRIEREETGMLWWSGVRDVPVWDFKKSMQARDEVRDQLYEWVKQNPDFNTKELQDKTDELMQPYAVEKTKAEIMRKHTQKADLQLPHFNSEEAVEAANLPSGTIVIINGRKARVK